MADDKSKEEPKPEPPVTSKPTEESTAQPEPAVDRSRERRPDVYVANVLRPRG